MAFRYLGLAEPDRDREERPITIEWRLRYAMPHEVLAAGLRALAPDLAGLYREALRLASHAADPGVAYLLCHAGRELSRGLLRYLSEGKVDADLVLAAPDQERNRVSIAAALGFARPTIRL